MAAEADDPKTIEEQVLPDRGPLRDLQPDRQPSAQRRYRCQRYYRRFGVDAEDGVFDRGAEFARPTGRAAIAGGSGKPRAPPRDRDGNCAFCRASLCADYRRHGFRDLLFANPCAGRVGPMFNVSNHGSSRGFHVHR